MLTDDTVIPSLSFILSQRGMDACGRILLDIAFYCMKEQGESGVDLQALGREMVVMVRSIVQSYVATHLDKVFGCISMLRRPILHRLITFTSSVDKGKKKAKV